MQCYPAMNVGHGGHCFRVHNEVVRITVLIIFTYENSQE